MKHWSRPGEVCFPPLTPEQQALAVEAMDRAKRFTRRYADTVQIGARTCEPRHRSDIESDATFAAVCAAGTFDAAKGDSKPADQKWKLWSTRRIHGSCSNVFRRPYWDHYKVASGTPLMELELRDHRSHVAEVDAAEEFEALVRRIPNEKTRHLLRLVYVQGYNMEEAGRVVGWSKRMAIYFHLQAIAKLRSFLEGRERKAICM